jgi:hypothetical protein
MSTPSLTKTGIYEFMTHKINKETKKMTDKITATINDTITATLSTLVNFEEIEEQSKVLRRMIGPVIEEYISVFNSGSGGIRGLESNLKSYGVNLTKHMHDTIRYSLIRAVDDPIKDPWTYTVPELVTMYDKIIKDTRPIKKTIKDLETMQTEVDRVIKLAGSGKAAYKNLVAMGVNMSDYEEPSRSLVLTHFSVPVCLVNGDC